MAKATIGVKDRTAQRVAIGTLDLDNMTIEMEETEDFADVYSSFNKKFVKVTIEEIVE